MSYSAETALDVLRAFQCVSNPSLREPTSVRACLTERFHCGPISFWRIRCYILRFGKASRSFRWHSVLRRVLILFSSYLTLATVSPSFFTGPLSPVIGSPLLEAVGTVVFLWAFSLFRGVAMGEAGLLPFPGPSSHLLHGWRVVSSFCKCGFLLFERPLSFPLILYMNVQSGEAQNSRCNQLLEAL